MGGQTHPTFHPTLVFSMLDEMLDAFDRGLSCIPGVGVRYKSTVIAEVNENEELSLDRLNRVRAQISKSKCT